MFWPSRLITIDILYSLARWTGSSIKQCASITSLYSKVHPRDMCLTWTLVRETSHNHYHRHTVPRFLLACAWWLTLVLFRCRSKLITMYYGICLIAVHVTHNNLTTDWEGSLALNLNSTLQCFYAPFRWRAFGTAMYVDAFQAIWVAVYFVFRDIFHSKATQAIIMQPSLAA
jgi:hypothetical protein